MKNATQISEGQKFHRLTAIRKGIEKRKWLFRCECGREKEIRVNDVLRGRSKSCVCYSVELVHERGRQQHGENIVHQKKKVARYEYYAFISMKNRCLNKKTKGYHRYGGRGITVCERWIRSFKNFYQDMGPRPAGSRISIDRIDNNGNYEPGNCRWATPLEQTNNCSTNRRIEFRGQVKTVAEWARELKLKSGLIYNRLARGWSIERALTVPVVTTTTPLSL